MAPIDRVLTVQDYVVNKESLFSSLDRFSRPLNSTPAIPVFLHITCHGCETGIQAGTDFVSWEELAFRLASLNAACGGALVLCMSSCEGISAIAMATMGVAVPPFKTIIGASGPVLTTVNAAWHSFYGRVSDGESLETAFASLKHHPDENFLMIEARDVWTEAFR